MDWAKTTGKTRRDTFWFWDLVYLIFEIWWYFFQCSPPLYDTKIPSHSLWIHISTPHKMKDLFFCFKHCQVLLSNIYHAVFSWYPTMCVTKIVPCDVFAAATEKIVQLKLICWALFFFKFHLEVSWMMSQFWFMSRLGVKWGKSQYICRQLDTTHSKLISPHKETEESYMTTSRAI